MPMLPRWCGEPVTVTGDAAVSPSFGSAGHAAAGMETGPDGHLATPVDIRLARGGAWR
jgi:hypothetical protein